MADRRHRLDGVEQRAHECDRLRQHPQRVGTHDAARQQQRVEVLRAGSIQGHVDRDLVAPVGEVPAACAFVLRLNQLDLLEAIRDQDGDLHAFEVRHLIYLPCLLSPENPACVL
jgi:hypothetical protein